MKDFMFIIILIMVMVSCRVAEEKSVFRRMEAHKPRKSFVQHRRSDGKEKHEVVVAIKKRNMDVIKREAIDRATPGSPVYQQWLSVKEVDDLVINLPAFQRVEKWLLSNEGVEIHWTSRRKDYIRVSAPIASWERMLNTHFYLFEDRSRKQVKKLEDKFMHRSLEYFIPKELEHDIDTIFHTVQAPPVFLPRYRTLGKGLNHRFKTNLRARINGYISTADSTVDVAFLNSYYQIESNTGSASLNQSVFETSNEYFSPTDLNDFQNHYSLTVQSAISIGGHSTTQSCDTGGIDCGEGNLDIQYIMGVAQVTSSVYWYVESSNQDPFVAWITDVADEENPPQSNSISWGSSEIAQPSSTMDSFDNEASILATRGVTITVSSGDDGAPSVNSYTGACQCNKVSSSSKTSWSGSNTWTGTGYFPSFPATSPWVTAVGATMGPNTGDPEIACQSQEGGYITSGGGFSTYYATPSWQTDSVNFYFSNLTSKEQPADGYNPQGRGYPDISIIGVEYQVYIDGTITSVWGTSASSPVIAAFVSLVNAIRLSNNLTAIGFLNPTLYAVGLNNTLGLGNIYNASFNDITSGNNQCCAYGNLNDPSGATCCTSGFFTTSGWDPITGWGSVNFPAFAAIFDVAAPYSADDSGDSSSGLSDAEIVGVVIAVLAGAAIISYGVFYLVGKMYASTGTHAQQNSASTVVIAQPIPAEGAVLTSPLYVQQSPTNRL